MTWQALLPRQMDDQSVECSHGIVRISWTPLHAADQDQSALNRADCCGKGAVLADVVWSCSAPGRPEWMVDDGETCRSLFRSRMEVENERKESVSR